MLRNYIKVIVRNFISDRMYTFINILGLVMGLAACLMIAQYVTFEMSFDKEVKDKDRIYLSYTHDDGWDQDTNSDPALAPFLLRSMPEVESAVRLFPISTLQVELILHKDDRKNTFYSKVSDTYFADPDVLNLFSIPLLEGDARSALVKPMTMVITRALADKFFPQESALDKTLSVSGFNGRQPIRITGICENPPANSSFQFEALFSFSSYNYQNEMDQLWAWGEFPTFIKLSKGADGQLVEQKMNDAVIGHFKWVDKKAEARESLQLVPFTDFHFFSDEESQYQDARTVFWR